MTLLKLIGISTYVSPITNLTAVSKGHVIAVDDSKAAYLMEGFEVDAANNHKPHWEVMPAGTKADYSFSGEFKVPEQPKGKPTIWHAPVEQDIDVDALEQVDIGKDGVVRDAEVAAEAATEAVIESAEKPAEEPARAPEPAAKQTQRVSRKKG